MILYSIIYGLFCLVFAAINADWIKDGNRIKHGWNGLIHAVAAGVAGLLYGWLAALILLLNSRVIFDTSLNLFRGKPIGYVSSKPASIIDRIEKKIFGNDGLTPKVVYIVLSVILHFIK